MKEGRINLYSDTQTRPSVAMRQAIANAEVGDEQNGLDPSINRLCAQVAEWLGHEAAVFMPSGTMCNEIAILVHCRPGDEILAHESSHIIGFEGGGPCALAGVHLNALAGEWGQYTAETLANSIRKPNRYTPTPALVEVEQTANLGGGTVWPLEKIQAVVDVARSRNLPLHLDGARLPNAVAAAGVDAASYAGSFDSAWIDLSKGLGCPMGAVLAGSRDFIENCWQWKQRMGGALRQGGIAAAAGLYAMEHNLERLADDHANAGKFADIVASTGIKLLPYPQTNIVFMDISATGVTAPAISQALEDEGINIGAFNDQLMRAVTHLDVSEQQVIEAANAFVRVIDKLS